MSPFDALLLGIVEGVTEFLPISSTAHLMFTSTLLGLPQSDFVKTFQIAIQSGAILAVVVLYWRSFLELDTIKKLVTAFIPTAVIGLALYPFIKSSLLGNVTIALVMLFLGGVFLIFFERWHLHRAPREARDISYRDALLIGLAQAVAVIPGVSRSAATIVGGLVLGLQRETIVKFSFLLAAPTMAAATSLDLLRSYQEFSAANFSTLAIGFVASFLVALAAMRWLLRFVRTHDFTSFGYYRIVAAALFFLFFLV